MKQTVPPPRRWVFLLPAAGYYGAIFFLSAQSRLPSGPSFPLSDKLIHGLVFAGFALTLLWGLRRALPSRPSAAPLVAAALGVLGGILDEVHQIFVPLRHADPADALADAVGIAAALAVAAWLLRRRRREPDRESGRTA